MVIGIEEQPDDDATIGLTKETLQASAQIRGGIGSTNSAVVSVKETNSKWSVAIRNARHASG